MARRTKEEAEQTRDLLLSVAEKLFLEKGVAKTSVEDIAKAAGMTRGAIYWHFEDKDALFKTMHEQVKLPFDLLMEEAIAKNDPIEGLKDMSIRAFQSIILDERSRNMFTILLFCCEQNDPKGCHVRRQQESRAECLQKLETIFGKMAKAGKLNPAMNPQTAAIFWHGVMSGIFHDYLRNPDTYDLVTLAPVYVDAALKGLVV